jgi:hypothetical protein
MVFFSHDCAGKRGLGEFRVLLGPGSPWVPKKKLFAQLTKIPALRVTSSVYLYQKGLLGTVKSANFVRTFSGYFVSFRDLGILKKMLSKVKNLMKQKRFQKLYQFLLLFFTKLISMQINTPGLLQVFRGH